MSFFFSFFFSIRAKTTLYILFLSLSHTTLICKFYFFFLNKLLILEEERFILSPLSLESWEEVLWSLCSLPTVRPSESKEVRDGYRPTLGSMLAGSWPKL